MMLECRTKYDFFRSKRRKNRLRSSSFLILLGVFLIPACAPAPVPPTPTSTPYPPLQSQGPYLLLMRDNNKMTIIDANGAGTKLITLPDDGFVSTPKNNLLGTVVSPDGKWLAYFTGSIEEPYDLALNIINLQNETAFQIARLIAPGFPENLAPVKTADPGELGNCTEQACRIQLLQTAFREGIRALAWSPDSQSLAFAAQSDGPSSDVYIFDIEDKSVRRLVNDLENVLQIDWSPHGDKILYKNSKAGQSFPTAYVYVASPTLKTVQSPTMITSGKFGYEFGWIAENLYLVAHGGEGAPPQNFRSINIETQQSWEIWPFTAQSFATDSENETLVVSTIPGGYFNNAPDEGTYLVSSAGTYSRITNERFTLYNGFKTAQVFGRQKNEIYSILFDGSMTLIGPSAWDREQEPIIVSPDRQWILLLENENKITLYSAKTYQQIKSWNIDETIYRVSWRPDSLGIFLLTDRQIDSLSIPNGEIIRLQDCSPNPRCPNKDMTWLP